MRYLYWAWFRDRRLPPDDQDCEWVACFLVESDDPEAALAWGDMLAKAHADRIGEPFLSSGIDVPTGTDFALPVVRVGDPASDEYIGWGCGSGATVAGTRLPRLLAVPLARDAS